MIQLKDIRFNYPGKKKIFDHLDLALHPGNIYGLLGKNGAGKSTLLKVLSGLIFPQEGTLRAFDLEIKERSPDFLKNIFIVPEEFDLPSLSIKKYVRYHGVFYPHFNLQLFQEYLKEFEIKERDKLSSLSYGQKKKFLLAFGLATNTKILILDEPTNGLDIPSKSQFRKIVASSMSEEKIMIISTHQVRDLENLIEAVVVLEQGQIVFNQTISAISDKLFFEDDLRDIQDSDILYKGETGSRSGIRINKDGVDSRVDLELLFNGIIKNRENIQKIF